MMLMMMMMMMMGPVGQEIVGLGVLAGVRS